MQCPTCGATMAIHGDCLICNSPFAAPRNVALYASPNLTADGAAGPPTAADIAAALGGSLSAREVEAHISQLPASYRLRIPAPIVGRHIELIDRAAGGNAIQHSIEDGVDHLTIATSDRPGILSQLAGALAARGVNILGGSAFTRDDGMAIDVLRVESLARMEDDWWDGVCTDVGLALDDQFPIEAELAVHLSQPSASVASVPTTVYVDNDPSSEFTKVEVNSVDRVGLLYALTRAIASCGIDIHLASVDTAGPLAVDTFYVRRPDGGRIEDDTVIEQLKDTIVSAVTRLGA